MTETVQEEVINHSKFILIVGLQNSGKTTYLKNEYKLLQELSQKQSENPKPYFIDAELSVSDWLNVPEFLDYLEEKKSEIKERGIKLTNKVKIEYLSDFLTDKHLLVDNIHRAATLKSAMLKLLLSKCYSATIATLDEGLISISLRDTILAENPNKVTLNTPKKYLPTFDITPAIFGILITLAVVMGNHTAAYVVAGLATMSFRQSRNAKQS